MELVCPSCLAVNRLPAEKAISAPKCGRCGAPVAPGAVLELKADALRRVIERDELPLVVDFWASWCGPCRIFAPIFAGAAVSRGGRVRLAKVNIEENPSAAEKHGIRSIPTLAAFRGGREIARVSGALGAQQLETWLNSLP